MKPVSTIRLDYLLAWLGFFLFGANLLGLPTWFCLSPYTDYYHVPLNDLPRMTLVRVSLIQASAIVLGGVASLKLLRVWQRRYGGNIPVFAWPVAILGYLMGCNFIFDAITIY